MSRKCVFCESSDLSREHVFPDWLAKYVGRDVQVINKMTGWNGASREWPQPIFKIKTRVVCKKCNSGWMSSLEGEVKQALGPMITTYGHTVNLTPDLQELLATWAVKTVYMASRTSINQENSIPPEHFKELYKTIKPPLSTKVFIGCREQICEPSGKKLAGFINQNIANLKTRTDEVAFFVKQRRENRQIYTATLALGHVVFFLIANQLQEAETFLIENNPDMLYRLYPEPKYKNIVWPNTFALEQVGGWERMHDLATDSVGARITNTPHKEYSVYQPSESIPSELRTCFKLIRNGAEQLDTIAKAKDYFNFALNIGKQQPPNLLPKIGELVFFTPIEKNVSGTDYCRAVTLELEDCFAYLNMEQLGVVENQSIKTWWLTLEYFIAKDHNVG